MSVQGACLELCFMSVLSHSLIPSNFSKARTTGLGQNPALNHRGGRSGCAALRLIWLRRSQLNFCPSKNLQRCMCMWCVCAGLLSGGLELQLVTHIPVSSCEFPNFPSLCCFSRQKRTSRDTRACSCTDSMG